MAAARITARNKPQIYGKYFRETRAWHIEGGSISPGKIKQRESFCEVKPAEKIYPTLN